MIADGRTHQVRVGEAPSGVIAVDHLASTEEVIMHVVVDDSIPLVPLLQVHEVCVVNPGTVANQACCSDIPSGRCESLEDVEEGEEGD